MLSWKLIFLAHLAATLVMIGIIWFVQVVHYPLFRNVDRSAFLVYETLHSRLTSLVVGPPMLIEAATALLLFKYKPEAVAEWKIWAGLGLLVVIWLSTAFVQVPLHQRLEKGFNLRDHRMLVITNWIRTVCWSARGLLVLTMTLKVLNQPEQ